jgi:hypothetical protein
MALLDIPEVLPRVPQTLHLWKMASQVKKTKYKFLYHESKFVGTGQRRLRTEFGQEPEKNVPVRT